MDKVLLKKQIELLIDIKDASYKEYNADLLQGIIDILKGLLK